MNLTELTDEELDQLRVDTLNEQERRANLSAIPQQIKNLTDKYVQGGGDKSDLTDMIESEDLPGE